MCCLWCLTKMEILSFKKIYLTLLFLLLIFELIDILLNLKVSILSKAFQNVFLYILIISKQVVNVIKTFCPK